MSSNAVEAGVRCWTQEQINFLSDVIATATFVNSAPPAENSLAGVADTASGPPVEVTFVISKIHKGAAPLDGKLIVRYPFGLQPEAAHLSVGFYSKEGDSYLLYLKTDTNNRFQPTSGPTAPEMSIRRLPRSAVSPPQEETIPIARPMASTNADRVPVAESASTLAHSSATC